VVAPRPAAPQYRGVITPNYQGGVAGPSYGTNTVTHKFGAIPSARPTPPGVPAAPRPPVAPVRPVAPVAPVAPHPVAAVTPAATPLTPAQVSAQQIRKQSANYGASILPDTRQEWQNARQRSIPASVVAQGGLRQALAYKPDPTHGVAAAAPIAYGTGPGAAPGLAGGGMLENYYNSRGASPGMAYG
jgi:hypothetical protein